MAQEALAIGFMTSPRPSPRPQSLFNHGSKPNLLTSTQTDKMQRRSFTSTKTHSTLQNEPVPGTSTHPLAQSRLSSPSVLLVQYLKRCPTLYPIRQHKAVLHPLITTDPGHAPRSLTLHHLPSHPWQHQCWYLQPQNRIQAKTHTGHRQDSTILMEMKPARPNLPVATHLINWSHNKHHHLNNHLLREESFHHRSHARLGLPPSQPKSQDRIHTRVMRFHHFPRRPPRQSHPSHPLTLDPKSVDDEPELNPRTKEYPMYHHN